LKVFGTAVDSGISFDFQP